MELLALTAVMVALWLWFEGSGSQPQPPPASAPYGAGPLSAMASAIYDLEGGGKPGATNSWNNNPGNIGGGQNSYSTPAQGWQELYDYISNQAQANPQWNFYDFFSNYLGTPGVLTTTSQGNASNYANYVAGQVGADPNQSVWGFLNGSNS